MYLDVVDLRDFYGRRLGLVARRLIGERLKARWPSLAGESLLGIGYATPYLRALGEGAERVLAFMPAAQGVVNWPREGPNAAALVAEDALPLPDASIDRVLVVHSLEVAANAREHLREIWRVLAPGGRVLIVVPQPQRHLGALGEDAVRLRPPVRTHAARPCCCATRCSRRSAGPRRSPCRRSAAAVAENRRGVGTGRAAAVAGVRRRRHRRGDQAALSGGAVARARPAPEAGAAAGADSAGA